MGPDAAPPRTPPPEQRFAARLAARQMSAPASARTAAVTVLNELGRVDLAVYRAIAGTPAPTLDRPIRRLSAAANWSRLWLAIGGAMAVAGGRAGRLAAVAGLGDRGRLRRRQRRPQGRRPTRAARPRLGRCTRCPEGADAGVSVLPSGQTASGFAFTNAVAHTLPAAAGPLGMLASAVGYARIHTGVHYPGDVVIGAVIGTAVGEAVGWGTRRLRGRRAS